MRRARRFAVAATVAAAVTLTSACASMLGGPGRAPDGTALPGIDELYGAMRVATAGAESGHVSGFGTFEEESLTVDVEGRTDGSNQRVRIGTERGRLAITTVDEKTYVNADWDFWLSYSDPQTATALQGMYVVATPRELRDYDEITIASIIDETFGEEGTLAWYLRVGASVSKRIDGDRTVLVGKTRKGEFWVDEETRRLARVAVWGDEPSELTFDRWDEADTFKAPKASRLIER